MKQVKIQPAVAGAPVSLEREGGGKAAEISRSMKQWNVTPYVYVREALGRLADGDGREALRLIEYAATFQGVYYAPASTDDRDFTNTMILLRYLTLHLADEFNRIGPEGAPFPD